MKIKSAFTLSEVLITLVIIGVVSALTVSSMLNSTRKKELHTAFLKTYSELNQAAKLFALYNAVSVPEYARENGLTLTINKFRYYYQTGEKNVTSSGMGTDDGSGNYTAYYTMHLLNREKFSGGANSSGKDSSFFCDNSGFQSSLSGALFLFNDAPSSSTTYNGPVICVDVNGRKGPNRYGADYFLFIFTNDNAVIPMGMSHDDNTPQNCTSASGSCGNFSNEGAAFCSKSANNPAYNTSCAFYALSNKHPHLDGKNYWDDFI